VRIFYKGYQIVPNKISTGYSWFKVHLETEADLEDSWGFGPNLSEIIQLIEDRLTPEENARWGDANATPYPGIQHGESE